MALKMNSLIARLPNNGNFVRSVICCLTRSISNSGEHAVIKESTGEKRQEEDESAHSYVMNKRRQAMKPTSIDSADSKPKKRALQLAKGERHDSQGFRNLRDQVENLDKLTHDELLAKLKNLVVYDHNDIVALSKPYGLPCHKGGGKHHHVLTDFLRELGSAIDPSNPNKELFTVHRLDKETTGVILLARSQQMAEKLRSMLGERRITKVYWTITTRVPRDREGIIDIPMAEGQVGEKYRMILKPELSKQFRSLGGANVSSVSDAVTYYRVLRELGSAALVELRPATGVKHQIRAHLGLGISCPILGDHKYSSVNRSDVPQRLADDTLRRLGIRETKTRTVPFHLHAKSLLVPDVLEGRDLVLTAPLPKFFVTNLKRLRLHSESAVRPNADMYGDSDN